MITIRYPQRGMTESVQGKIAILRCPLLNTCVSISNVFTTFENFNFVPTEFIINKIIFRELLKVVKSTDFVVLVACEHLNSKISTILQCLKDTKTVLTGKLSKTGTKDTSLKHFPVVPIDSIASYVHANFNYDCLSFKATESEIGDDLSLSSCVSIPNTADAGLKDFNGGTCSTYTNGTKEDERGRTCCLSRSAAIIEDQCTLRGTKNENGDMPLTECINIPKDFDSGIGSTYTYGRRSISTFPHSDEICEDQYSPKDGTVFWLEGTMDFGDTDHDNTDYGNTDYDNTENSKHVVVMRCILQDRCTWTSNLHATLEKYNFNTTDFSIETNILSQDLPSVVNQSDFVVLVICKHLLHHLRKIKRYLQEISKRVLITGAWHGPQTKEVFQGFKCFNIKDVEQIASYIQTFLSSDIPESVQDDSSDYFETHTKEGCSIKTSLDRKRSKFVHAASLESTDTFRGTLLNTTACFPKVVLRSETPANQKERFFTVANDEKKDIVKQIQNMTVQSLSESSDCLGLISLLGIPDYYIQGSIISSLNQIQLENDTVNRSRKISDLLKAAKGLIGIVKSSFGDSHTMENVLPVTLDMVTMLYLSTLTTATLEGNMREEIDTFCWECEKEISGISAAYSLKKTNLTSTLFFSLHLILSDFKLRVGHSTALQIGNFNEALLVPENRSRIRTHFDKTMCYLEQYTCLCIVANLVTRTMESDLIEFFNQLVRQLLQKARKKPKVKQGLFSALYLVTKAIVFKLEPDRETSNVPTHVKVKLGKILNLYLDNNKLDQPLRYKLLSMIEPLLLSDVQQIVVNTVYLFRKTDVNSNDMRYKLLAVLEKNMTAIKLKIRVPSIHKVDSGFKAEWQSFDGTISEDIDVVLHILIPTLNCLSKGDVGEYLLNSNTQETEREINTLRILHHLHEQIEHDNIAKLYAFQRRSIPVFYITEKVKGPDLLTYLLNSRSSESGISEQELLRLLKEIFEAVLYLHNNNIIHRNLTCSAFSIRNQGSVFLHDFSLCKILKTDACFILDVETPEIPVLWSAPESIFEDRYDERTDAWMIGNMMYEIFTLGCHPYTEVYNTPIEQILEYVLFRDLKLYKWPCVPAEIHDVILSLTQTDPNDRPSISQAKAKIQQITRNCTETVQGTNINTPLTDTECQYYPELDVDQGLPERKVPDIFLQLKCSNGRSSSATKMSGNVYINTRICHRLFRNTLAVTPMDCIAPDTPRIIQRLRFIDVREPVTLKFLRLLPNIDEETYRNVLCLYDSPQKHLTETRKKMQHQNFSFYLKYRVRKGTNVLESAFRHQFGDPDIYEENYLHVVVKMASFVHNMHSRKWILGDLCAENLYIAEDTEQVCMPRLGRLLFFEETNGIEDCIVGNMYQDRRRWNPIEVLQHGQYSFESDIYRLAMTIYEFYTALEIHHIDPMADHLHCSPFANVENEELLDVLYHGTHPLRPRYCPGWLYGILLSCWDRDRTQRPSALWLTDIISRQLTNRQPTGNSVFDRQYDKTTKEKEITPPVLPLRTNIQQRTDCHSTFSRKPFYSENTLPINYNTTKEKEITQPVLPLRTNIQQRTDCHSTFSRTPIYSENTLPINYSLSTREQNIKHGHKLVHSVVDYETEMPSISKNAKEEIVNISWHNTLNTLASPDPENIPSYRSDEKHNSLFTNNEENEDSVGDSNSQTFDNFVDELKHRMSHMLKINPCLESEHSVPQENTNNDDNCFNDIYIDPVYLV